MSASERVTDAGRVRLRGLLDAGDPYSEVRDAWHAKETLRSIYDIDDAEVGSDTVAQLAADLQDPAMALDINRLGRTVERWRTQIANWHTARVTNALRTQARDGATLRRLADGMLERARVTQLPEPVSPSYRNRVRGV